MKKYFLTLALTIFWLSSTISFAQEKSEGYVFTDVKVIKDTETKNQHRSGTCWSFSGLGFFEAELIRIGKGEFDLSEMFIVRNTYAEKAKRYIRMHGNMNFGGGGAFQDVVDVIQKYGIVPEASCRGLEYGEKGHVHGELDAGLKGYVDAIIKNDNKSLSTAWLKGFEGILSAYLGEYPSNFTYKGKKYTPKSFKDYLGLDMKNYVQISSYTHHEFYAPFVIEVPDNWSSGIVQNVQINDFEVIIDNAIDKGYTVAWAADVSEKGISFGQGIAIVPDINFDEMSDTEQSKWDKMSKTERKSYAFNKPGKEKKITQEMRQIAFDNYQTTDDHGMQIVGVAKDQKGNKYYKIKNSWGTTYNKYGGYFYVSVPFIKYKTMSIMVNKESVPANIAKKLKL